MIPTYQDPTNNPTAISNEQKEIYQTKPQKQVQSQQPTISFQYTQPRPPQRPSNNMDPAPYMPVYTNVGNTYQSQPYPTWMYNQQMGEYPSQFALPPIIKNTYINTIGPNGNHERIFHVYEDSLLSKSVIATYSTIAERTNMSQYIRSNILNGKDGNDISFDGNSDNSLLSFVKFAELNPYNTYKLSSNVYKGMPDDYMIYRSCYPIRCAEGSGAVTCARDATGINIRIYKMLEKSYKVNRTDPSSYFNFDEWREIVFYEYIRENIIKKKVCPQFVMLYGYFISEKANIDFNKINKLKYGKEKTTQQTNQFIVKDALTDPLIAPMMLGNATSAGKIIEPNPEAYLGKALVLLTESPTYGLYGWASKTYQVKGTIKEMINTGVHTVEEWKNVIFQIMIGLYVMQINKIYIENFSLENNVFIKDLTLKGQITEYWKYKVLGIDFYIPNLGYVIMLDTNYKDVIEDTSITLGPMSGKLPNKLNGKIYNTNNMTDSEINDKIFDMFGIAMKSDIFTNPSFGQFGGVKPPDEIIALLSNITTDVTADVEKNISIYIFKYMTCYLHNRIGTYLRENEVNNIRRDDTRQFTTGQLVVLEDGYGSYKFVIYININQNGLARIYTKNEHTDNDIIESTVPITSLINYSKAEPITQTYKANEAKMNEDELLETYIIQI